MKSIIVVAVASLVIGGCVYPGYSVKNWDEMTPYERQRELDDRETLGAVLLGVATVGTAVALTEPYHRGPPRRHYRRPPPQQRRGPPPRQRRGPPPQQRRGPPQQQRRGPPPRQRRGPPPQQRRGPPAGRRGGRPPR